MINFSLRKPLILALILFSNISCAYADNNVATDKQESINTSKNKNYMNIKVNGQNLTVRLSDNSSSKALRELLKKGDITVKMQDYGRFEKYGKLPQSLPRNDERITTSSGDVILSEGNLLVIYYDVNTWNFTLLGKIEGLSQRQLKEILGDADIKVVISLAE